MDGKKQDVLAQMNKIVECCLKESCGKCVACRVGSKRMSEIIQRVTNGNDLPWDLVTLQNLCQYMKITSACGTGKLTAMNLEGMIPMIAQQEIRR